MENVKKLLDEVKARAGVDTDYALAKVLDLPTQRISDYYKGQRAPDEFACLKIAQVLGKPLEVVIATVKMDTEKNEKRRLAWRQHFKSLGVALQLFMIAAFVLVTSIVTYPAQALAGEQIQSGEREVVQIMRG